MSETIAVIGIGNVGSGLGRRLASSGLSVVYGVRDEFDPSLTEGGERAAPVPEAIEAASIVILAIPGNVVPDFAREHAALLRGKIVVDATNPIRWEAGPVWAPPEEGSNAQLIADLTEADVVKGFNGFGAEFHADPMIGNEGAEVFLAGAPEATERVAEVARRGGFRPTYAGPLRNASVLENTAILWIHLALAEKLGRDFVVQRVHRK